MRKGCISKSKCFCIAVFIIVYKQLLKYIQLEQFSRSNIDEGSTANTFSQDLSRYNFNEKHIKLIRITWYIPPVFLIYKPDAMFSGFEGCLFSNCKMSYAMTDAAYSDAVILTGRKIPQNLHFDRPSGQIWIFYEQEPPYRYSELNTVWNQSNIFNWTMTYDRSVSDIHLPYGQIREKNNIGKINYDEIMQRKNRKALIIISHCYTPADRMRYIEKLTKHIEVDVVGNCGVQWDCGQRYLHNDCFEIINSYRFYLSFENSLCNNYFTEKVFENFDYDTVLVSRGGKQGQSKQLIPEGTFISTDDFKNASDLGIYLRLMSDEAYINILKRKQQYTSIDSFRLVFHKAMCNICYRMNNINKFQKVIKDMNNWAYYSNPCVPPSDF